MRFLIQRRPSPSLVMSGYFIGVFTLSLLYLRVYSIWDGGILAQSWGIHSEIGTLVYLGLIYSVCGILKHWISDALVAGVNHV